MLGHIVKHHIQFLFAEDLRGRLGLFKKLLYDVRDILGRYAEIRSDLLNSVLH